MGLVIVGPLVDIHPVRLSSRVRKRRCRNCGEIASRSLRQIIRDRHEILDFGSGLLALRVRPRALRVIDSILRRRAPSPAVAVQVNGVLDYGVDTAACVARVR